MTEYEIERAVNFAQQIESGKREWPVPRWPAMSRVHSDKKCILMPIAKIVIHWYESADVALKMVERSTELGIGITPSVEIVPNFPHYTVQRYIEGVHPCNPAPIRRMLHRIHDGTASAPITRVRKNVYEFVLSRVDRLKKNQPHQPDLIDEVQVWVDENCRQLTSNYGPWHGDPTVTNAIVERNTRRLLLIDHSIERYGFAEYDRAKLDRSLILSDDAEWHDDPSHYAGDRWLGIVLIGMLGSHCPDTVLYHRLLTFWRTIK